MTVLLVFLATGAGAYCRYRLDSWAQGRWPGPLPWGLLLVNLTGSLALGFLTGAATQLAPGEGQMMTLILGTGLLGGYTTFSSAILASLQEKSWPRRLLIWLVQPLLALGAALLGLWFWS